MNKTMKIALVVGALSAAYPATAWFLGQKVESAVNEQYTKMSNNPFVKVVERDYQRGIFSATENVTLEFSGTMMKAMLEMAPEESQSAAKPLRVTIRSEVKHGPFAAGEGFAAAVADSELVFDEETKKQLNALLGDKKLLTAHTVYRLDGGGKASLSSPAFSTSWQGETPEATGSLVWEGVSTSVDFSAGMTSYSFVGSIPKVEFKDGKGSTLSMTGLSINGEQKRLFDDEPLLYVGKQQINMAGFSISKGESGETPVILKQLTYVIEMPVNGEFIDLVAKVGAEALHIGKKNYGPAHYDFSLRHAHARTVAKLHRAMLDLYADPKLVAEMGKNDPTQLLATLRAPALELLQHNPEVSIDRLSFSSANGEAKLAVRASLKDIKPEEFDNPLAVIGKLQANAELSLSEAMIDDLIGKNDADADDEDDSNSDAVHQHVASLVEQGYVTLEQGTIRSKAEFANGQLAVNGKPFNPLAMLGMGAAAPKKSAMRH